MSNTNQFQVLNDDTSKNHAPIIYDKNGNIDMNASLPEFAELCNAMERGESWYDLMYPRGEDITVTGGGWAEVGKKRKRPVSINSNKYSIPKRTRYD